MRELILATEAGTLIGSLRDLARQLGVGIVTVQQVARVLEHEGLLEVRRGPGGGYFGRRPDPETLERSLAAYLRARHAGDYEALEMMTLLDCELFPAAARAADAPALAGLGALGDEIGTCETSHQRLAFEDRLHDIIFRIIDRPLVALLAQVTMRYYRGAAIPAIFDGDHGLAAWRAWRRGVIGAVLARDPELARFEAERHRRLLLQRLDEARRCRC